MALKKYIDGAWQDVTTSKRHNGTDWQDCDSVKKHDGSNWVDVWSGNKFYLYKDGNEYTDITGGYSAGIGTSLTKESNELVARPTNDYSTKIIIKLGVNTLRPYYANKTNIVIKGTINMGTGIGNELWIQYYYNLSETINNLGIKVGALGRGETYNFEVTLPLNYYIKKYDGESLDVRLIDIDYGLFFPYTEFRIREMYIE